MKIIYRAGLFSYALGLGLIAIQQFLYEDLRPVIIPPDWPMWMHAAPVWAYITGTLIVATCVLMITGIKIKEAAIFLGFLLLILCLTVQIPYRLFIGPYSPRHVGVWTDALKELALSGGAFIIAGSIGKDNRLVLAGRAFFSIMMILFGYAHFLYTDSISTLVPSWIPGSIFWTYFAGIALIGSGVAILFRVRIQLISLLTGIMIILWAIVLHLPRAIAATVADKGNEVTSLFEALAFSGIAFAIAFTYTTKNDHAQKPIV